MKQKEEEYERKKESKIKKQKLLNCARDGNLIAVKNAGFRYETEDVNVKDENLNSPLYYATKHRDMNFIQWLIEQGADVNALCENNNTPMHLAFESNSIDLIFLFINAGGDLNLVNSVG
jgi:ankyrin repeat protein